MGRVCNLYAGAGLSIEALIEYVSLCQQGDKTSAERKALLVGQRDVLISKIEELKRLWHA